MATEDIPQNQPIVTYAEAKAAGLKLFFTGKPCKYGHIAPHRVAGNCIECEKGLAHKERNRKWAENNRGKRVASVQRWQKKNPEKVRVARRKRYKNNQEKSNIAVAEWKKANPEKARAHRRQSYRNNPERFAAVRHRRRALKKKHGGNFTAADIKRILKLQKGKCAYYGICRHKIPPYHIDHIVPLIAGGSNTPSNIQLLCMPCNSKKRDLDQIEFMQRNGQLL